MRIFSWLVRAFIFFTLFAFALNNQHTASVHWFFGVEWRAPMVFVVLAAFAAGCALSAVALMPGWLKSRQASHPGAAGAGATDNKAVASPAGAVVAGAHTRTSGMAAAAPSDFGTTDHPPRLGV